MKLSIGPLLLVLAGCTAPMEVHVAFDGVSEVVLTRDLHHRCFVAQVDSGDGVARPFLVDTGASLCVVDTELLQRLLGEDVRAGEVYALEEVKVGPLRAQHVPVLAHDMSSLEVAFGRPLAGIVGFPVFEPVLLEIDYPAEEIRLRQGSLPTTDGQWVLPLRMEFGCPWIDVTIAGERHSMLIDTGAACGLAVSELPLDRLRDPPRKVASVVTIQGRRDRIAARLDHDVRVGPVLFREPWLFQHERGLVGWGVLHHFVITLDQRNHRVRLMSHRKVISQ